MAAGVDPAGDSADGRKATNLEQDPNFEDHTAPPKLPSLRVTCREGYDVFAHDIDLWVVSLPPPGPLAIWPEG